MGERIAVVTGASKGIGREIARGLVARGARVIGASRSVDDPPEGTVPFAFDVADPAAIDALAKEVAGGLDILVNNAGISMRGFDANVAKTTLGVNFFGPLHLTRALLPHLREGGRVVMVSSGLGDLSCVSPDLRRRFLDPKLTEAELARLAQSFVDDVASGTHTARGWPSSAYAVSKVALNALTRVLARELAEDPRRILVNAVCPGWVRTQMGGAGASRSPAKGAETPIWAALLPEGGPSGRLFRDKAEVAW